MSNASAEIQMLSLKDIVDPKRGMTYNANQLTEADGSVLAYFNMKSFLKSGGLNTEGTKWFSGRVPPEFVLDESDVVIANTDVTPGSDIIGSAAHVPSEYVGKAAFSHHVTRLRVKSQAVKPQFLARALLLERVRRAMRAESRGTTVKMLDIAGALAIKVGVLPLEEQSLVINILDTLDTAIQETEAIIAKLKAIKQGLLHDLLTRGIDANGELRPPQTEAPHLYKQSPLGWIPEEWDLSTVGEQFEIQLGKMLDGQKNTGILKPYLGNKAVQWDRIDLGEVQQMRLSKVDMIRFRLQKGDLLVCEGGEVGRAAIWDNELGECYYQKALHRLRPLSGYHPRLMLETLRYFMERDALSEFISRTSIAHLTQEKLAAVPLPTPKADEQDRIVAKTLAAKQHLETEELQLLKLGLLKSGLMDDLLTGRVRVTPLLAAERQERSA